MADAVRPPSIRPEHKCHLCCQTLIMPLYLLTLGAGLSFLFLAVLFWPLETLFPARPQRLLRPHCWRDLAFFLGQYLLWACCGLSTLHVFSGRSEGIIPGEFRALVRSHP